MKTVQLYGKKAAGRVALVDDHDYELVDQHRWRIFEEKRPGRPHGPYAIANIRRSDGCMTTLRMHCLIMGTTGIDHRDGNGLNNQRYNLRVATAVQNHANMRPRRTGTSRFKGVSWSSSQQKGYADIQVNRIRYRLGCFSDEEDAARAYDAVAAREQGEFAVLNFPVRADQ